MAKVTSTLPYAMFKESLLRYARRAYSEKRADSSALDVAMISPTPLDLIRTVVSDLSLYLKASSDFVFICDLGCGDGRWLFALMDSNEFDYNCVCYGVEISDERITKTVLNQLHRNIDVDDNVTSHRVKLLEVVKADFFQHMRFDDIDVVIAYLSIEGNRLLKDKIEHECRKGTLVVSVGFKIHGLPVQKMWESKERTLFFAYLYIL